MAMFNLFEAGQKVVVASTGFFGTRLIEIARQHRLEVIEVPVEVGAPADPSESPMPSPGRRNLDRARRHRDGGPPSDRGHRARCARRRRDYLVDGIASVGGELVDVDRMVIDAVVTGTQRASGPAGARHPRVGRAGRARVAARSERPNSWYLDIEVWDWYRKEWGAWHPHPVTMPTNLVMALDSSLRRIMEVGFESWIARRADLAKRCREGLRGLGLEPVPHAGHEANLVVAAWVDQPAEIQKYLLEKEGIMISGGLTPTLGKAIRVGLMGATATDDCGRVSRRGGGARRARLFAESRHRLRSVPLPEGSPRDRPICTSETEPAVRRSKRRRRLRDRRRLPLPVAP